MDTDKLKSLLVEDLDSRRKVALPIIQAKRFILLSLVIVTGITLLLGMREDFLFVMGGLGFYVELIVLVVLVYSLIITTLKIATPGIEVKNNLILIASILLFWPTYLYLCSADKIVPVNEIEYSCSRLILICTIVFSSILFSIVSKNYTTRPNLTVALATLSCSGIGGLLLHLVCPESTFNHVFLWHYIPVIIAPMLGLLAYLAVKKRI